jgi:ABC-2 type transport system ATP-binding protein
MIETKNVSKSFGKVNAIRNLSLNVPAGEIYGLVGSDGAGKTTLLRLLVGALRPDAGQVFICGHAIDREVEQARAKIGYLSQRFSLYEDLTVLENIRFFAEVRGLSAVDWRPRSMEILDFVGLAVFKDRMAGVLSGGMKQKLGLASALVTRPQVLLLDEPTTGVDPVTRQDFWQLLVKLVTRTDNASGPVAVVITTPYMDEASRCKRIGFLRQGELIAEGTPTQLRAGLNGSILELRGGALRELRALVAMDPDVEDVHLFGDRLHLRTLPGKAVDVIKNLEKKIFEAGYDLDSIRQVPANLEDVFIVLSGQGGNVLEASLELPEAQSRVLEFILERIPPGEYGWILTGSCSLRLQGVNVTVNDLDIECNATTIHQIEKELNEFIKTPVHPWENDNIRSLDGKAEIEGIQVEIIAEKEGRNPDGSWARLGNFENKIYLHWHDRQVPVFPLQNEAEAYEAMGRSEKARLIRETIQRSKEADHA